MSTQDSVITEFFIETLDRASSAIERFRDSTGLEVSYKADASLVTAADLASEKVICDRIAKYFPADHIYSEEQGSTTKQRQEGDYIWIIDPLDGTTNFANGYPFYCVSIARGQIGKNGTITVTHGGIRECARRRSFIAASGKGAYLDGRRIHCGVDRPLEKALLVTGFYYMKGDALRSEIDRFARVAAKCQSIRRDGAAALDLAYVALGVFDGFWELGLQPWDVAAGSLIVSEAGGRVFNYNFANVYDIEGAGIVAGNATTVQDLRTVL